MLPVVSTSSAAPLSASYGTETTSASSSFPATTTYSSMHRPSLPTLHTRSSYMANEYDQQYDNSPIDAYTYASSTIPRQDSYSSSLGSQDSYRSFSAAPLSAPPTAPFYEQSQGAYSFGNLHGPAPGRLPSVTSDTMSSLNNLDSLHSSLPMNPPAERRRLPAPYTISYPQPTWSSQPQPDLRPFDTPNFRPHINGIHSRNAMGWSPDSVLPRNSSISQQTQTNHPQHQQPQHPSTQPGTFSSVSGPSEPPTAPPSFGYQFQHSASYSPDTNSPISAPDGFPNPTPSTSSNASTTAVQLPPALSMAPPPRLRYTSSSSTSLPALADFAAVAAPSSLSSSSARHHEAAASLYSFSSESAASPEMVRPPHHAASCEGLRRQSEFEGVGVAHRSSVGSLLER
jgi:hypothetical protein